MNNNYYYKQPRGTWRPKMSTTKRKKRYNSKARQGNALPLKRGQAPPDTNYPVIIPAAASTSSLLAQGEEAKPSRKRLNSRQKKKLRAILEKKSKKEKRAAIISSLQSLSLASSEMNLLQRSTDLTKNRLTAKEIMERTSREAPLAINQYSNAEPVTGRAERGGEGREGKGAIPNSKSINTTRRRQRKRRRHFVEKRILEPRIENDETTDCISSEEDDEDTNVTNDLNQNETPSQLAEDEGTEPSLPDHPTSLLTPPTSPPTVTMETDPPPPPPPPVDPAVYVKVDRSPAVQSSRLSLPILSEEHVIIEAVRENPVVIVCGETGSGKTTQVPQFLYESGLTLLGAEPGKKSMIGITEPRRVAAVAMAKRVGHEMNLTSREVSYQIRYEGNTSSSTEIKFMTDGVLLKEIEKDFLLSNYSVVIIDEAHERSVYSDILIGLLSRIVPLRNKSGRPLKFLIMSATLRVSDFTENPTLFPTPPPVVQIQSRQYPVTIHFNRITPQNYLSAAYRKICKIHSSLPSGHILVFLTGRQEIIQLVKKLKTAFPSPCLSSGSSGERKEREEEEEEMEREASDVDARVEEGMKGSRRNKGRRGRTRSGGFIDLNDYPSASQDTMQLTAGLTSSESDISDSNEGTELISTTSSLPLMVFPLYSTLSPEEQAKVFESPPDGCRVCIVATNVAETSITIPHVKYVLDTGKVKRKYYDIVTGVSTLRVDWISKASANQRGGRAGRTEPGHCYRLYSSSVFQNNFSEFSEPDITQQPVEDLVLQMKAMNIVKVTNFPFPTPPTTEALKAAEKLLTELGALDPHTSAVTPLGLTMSSIPVSPSYSKMLSLAHQNDCLPYMVVIVSALSVRELFLSETETSHRNLTQTRKQWSGQGEGRLLGDLMVLLRAVQGYERASDRVGYCREGGIRLKAMEEVRKLRQQLTNTINGISSKGDLCTDPNLAPPTQEQAKFLRQLVLAGLPTRVARKIDTKAMSVDDKKKHRHAYECSLVDGPIYLHSSSSLSSSSSLPQFVVFQELYETSRLYMRNVCVIEKEWLPRLLPGRCVFSDPLDEPPPTFNQETGQVECFMDYSFGSWSLGSQSFPYPDSIERYKWFALFLLKGEVSPGFKEFSDSLLSPPVTMIKSWAKLQKRTQALLASLVEKGVSSRKELKDVWKTDTKFLLPHLAMWLPQRLHNSLSEKWNNIITSTK